ncbi:MAG: M1 family metallopeptidase [Nocardioides sp.]
MRRLPLVLALVALAVALAVGAGVRLLHHGDGTERAPAGGGPASGSPATGGPISAGEAVDAALAPALSEPVEDSYYPRVGDPGVDSLHYGLDLTWDPTARELTGEATVTFRSTQDADSFQLDLAAPLDVTAVTLDGQDVGFEHPGKDLVVRAGVAGDREYTAVIDYHGTPEPVDAPATRPDLPSVGWTVTQTGAVWTMQEPFGAFTWYPVNDQPSDKALYDFTIRVPAPWVGVANGELISRRVRDEMTVTRFHLGSPAASYLVTIGIGDFASRTDRSASGVPLTYWVERPVGQRFRALRQAADALDWIEQKLGPYPYTTAGILLVDSESGMETQTLVTLGDTPYATSPKVILHELVHQWYGDLVTPRDWRDVWMNEGMTTYLQLVYESESSGTDLEATMRDVADLDQQYRDQAGPPGDYLAGEFGSGNVYFCPALMWHRLRQGLGDEEFWRLVREWPRVHAFGNADRDDWFAWVEEQTGRDLDAFFAAWIDGETTPPQSLLSP